MGEYEVEWKVAQCPRTGRPYYYHPVTRETTWKKPASLIKKEKEAASHFFRTMETNIKNKLRAGRLEPEPHVPEVLAKGPPRLFRTLSAKEDDTTPPVHSRKPKLSTGPPRLFRTLSAKEDMNEDVPVYGMLSSTLPSPIPENRESLVGPGTPVLQERASFTDGSAYREEALTSVVPPQPLRMRSNSTNSIYVRMGTMNKPDVKSTMLCVAHVIRGHVLEAHATPLPADPRFYGFLSIEALQATSLKKLPLPSVDDIVAFMHQVHTKAQMESECIIMSLIYVERLLQATMGKGLQIHAGNWHAIVFSSMVMASKVWDDLSMCNADFSKICHVTFPLRRINTLELLYLDAVEYNVRVSAASYAKYYFHLRTIYKSLSIGQLSAFDSNTPLNLEGARKMQVISEDYEERIKLLPPPLRRRSRTIASPMPNDKMLEDEYRYSDLTAPPASIEQLVHMELKSAGGNSPLSFSKRHSE
ncbi:cyclin-Y-like protein [Achlya hypogyna]|uniref:Cyclin-Y-like protein n=1 Tax=Achlya hypogyna TaxID=1202772 RepID=A0A1V9YKP5_ACHHY|nr:cyclin-Y-like protein [Achlya hypogyna]